ncbi:DUF2975 domain-containing protein [Nocardiopsis lambiniae]|uniref:DUF2975 domain-containing protein n=1 Tax=Nocardiopsis lambiniae TaxID=3075539 RepID=A0ABU2M9C3_9ACTN|nr:DUF2975 domain-containing protein [Nocardiopsis sp. DSM 44743]MDT0328760.1 DUF2975 domain-containing protein [Nocardiopsis sp. DSM 44743]
MSERSPLRWSRGDAVITRFVLVIGLVFAGLTTLYALLWITPLLPAEGGAPFNAITVAIPDGVPATAPPVGTADADHTVEAAGTMTLVFHDPTTVQRFLLVLPSLLVMIATLVVMAGLSGIVRSLDAGDPFVRANVRRLRIIAFTVLLGAILVPVVEMFRNDVLTAAALGSGPLEVSVVLIGEGGIRFTFVFVGLLLAGLAEVFRRGTLMRDDVQGLV